MISNDAITSWKTNRHLTNTLPYPVCTRICGLQRHSCSQAYKKKIIYYIMNCLWRAHNNFTMCPLYLLSWNHHTLVHSWLMQVARRRNGNPLQFSCLGNSMDRGASGATVQRVAEEWKQLSYCTIAKSNKDLLFRIRNSVQYSVRTHWGKESKKRWI